QRRGTPLEVGPVEGERASAIEVRVVDATELREEEDQLADADRTTLEPDPGPRAKVPELSRHLEHPRVDVLMLRVVRVERLAALVLAPDLDDLAADVAVPFHAVADEDDLLAVGDIERAFVAAEDEVDARQLSIALVVREPEELDDLLHHAR